MGGAPGKLDLYVGKEVVRRAVDMEVACEELIDLIKVRGRIENARVRVWRTSVRWLGPAGLTVEGGRCTLHAELPGACPNPTHFQEHGRWQDPEVEEESEAAAAAAATA